MKGYTVYYFAKISKIDFLKLLGKGKILKLKMYLNVSMFSEHYVFFALGTSQFFSSTLLRCGEHRGKSAIFNY